MRLIDADAFCTECIENLYLLSCDGCVIKDFKLRNTIEAEPVRRGKWLYSSIENPAYRICDQCGSVYKIRKEDGKFNRCPCCGVRMDGKGEKE